MRRAAIAAPAVLSAVLAVGCGSPPGGAVDAATSSGPSSRPAPVAAPVPGIEAEAVRLRTDEAVGGRIQVRITATGDEPFEVTAVALDSPGFAPLPATPLRAEFAPGRVIDLPTPYGEPRCDAAPEPAAARLTLTRPDGRVEDLRVPLSAEVLGRIHRRECAVRAVGEVVDIAVAGLREQGDAVTGELVLTRVGAGERVTAERLSRSVLLDVAAEGLPIELDPGERTASVPVRFTPATCDPHVLAETKKPYVFPVVVTVGQGEEVPVDLPLDAAARDLLAALVDRVCTTSG